MTELTKENVIEFIKNMTIMELSEFVKELETCFGVSATPTMNVLPGQKTDQETAVVEEKTEFNVILTSFGEQKIQVIKVVRSITGLGLKEAKDLVEGVPKSIKEGISKTEAEEIKKKLEETGATIEIK